MTDPTGFVAYILRFHLHAWFKLQVHWTDQSETVLYSTWLEMDDNDVDLSKRLMDCVEVSGFRVSRPHPLPRNASTLRSTTAFATTPRPPLISIAILFYMDGRVARGGVEVRRGAADGTAKETVLGNVIWHGVSGFPSYGTGVCGTQTDSFRPSSRRGSSSRRKRLDFRQSPANVPDVPLRVCDMLNLARRSNVGNDGGVQRPPGSAWQRVTHSAIQLPDEHACTITRSLLDFAVRWDVSRRGTVTVLPPALKSAKRFDGTVYLRVVMLTFDWLGWGVGEGGEVVALWGSVQLVNAVIEYLDNLIHVKHWHLDVSLVEQ
ncbi:hypothetical protein H4582DRAFT_2172376 [Lactarius indigo]|nr:hypothetical protein H4582DRAFT_2172376 [Lactarius indigo]